MAGEGSYATTPRGALLWDQGHDKKTPLAQGERGLSVNSRYHQMMAGPITGKSDIAIQLVTGVRSGTRYSTPSGGTLSRAECARPFHGTGSEYTRPRLPTPEPP